jgi:ribosomal protein S12 methylthiotransferase accessory factor
MEIRLGEGRRVRASYGGFEIETDQSLENGGDASAPEPFDLFLASLGTCSGFYVQTFCRTREIDAEGIVLRESWERDDEGRLAEIKIEIEVPESFPERYRKALLRAAGQCSVKKALETPPSVSTELVQRPRR